MLPLGRYILGLWGINCTIQAGVGYYSIYHLKSEKYFDAAGLGSFPALSIISQLPRPQRKFGQPFRPFDTIKLTSTWAIGVWALHILQERITRTNSKMIDSRFDEIRDNPQKFAAAWAIQALWVGMVSMPNWIMNLSPSLALAKRSPPITFVGAFVFMSGFFIELMADSTKTQFKEKPENKGKFIDQGYWKIIEFPNYLGEIIIWIGMSIYCWPYVRLHGVLAKSTCFLSPAYLAYQLTYVSGVNLQRKQAEERWGDDPAYWRHRNRVGMYWPKLTTLLGWNWDK